MKTLSIYTFNELPLDRQLDLQKRFASEISWRSDYKPTPKSKREWLKECVESWVFDYYTKNPLPFTEVTDNWGHEVFDRKKWVKPQFIVFGESIVQIKLMCRDFKIVLADGTALRFSKVEAANAVKGTRGEVFQFDKKQALFEVWFDERYRPKFDVNDSESWCLLPDHIQTSIKQTADWFRDNEELLSQEVSKYVATLSYTAYLEELEKKVIPKSELYFRDKWFYENGDPVACEFVYDTHWKQS